MVAAPLQSQGATGVLHLAAPLRGQVVRAMGATTTDVGQHLTIVTSHPVPLSLAIPASEDVSPATIAMGEEEAGVQGAGFPEGATLTAPDLRGIVATAPGRLDLSRLALPWGVVGTVEALHPRLHQLRVVMALGAEEEEGWGLSLA